MHSPRWSTASARQHGVTLVELLMVVAATAVIMVPVVAMLDTTVDAGSAVATRRALDQDAAFAIERIAARIRATPRRRLDPNTSASDSESWFPARFSKKASQLVEKLDGTERVIADSVTAFSITAQNVGADATLVEATVELQLGAETASATTVVRMGGLR